MHSTSSASHENISRRAYHFWEETGRQEGDGTAHWLQAESELRAQDAKTGEVDAARGKSVEPAAVGRHPAQEARHSADYVHPGVTTDSLHHARNR